ncbi:Elongation factor Ts, mitochondrial [Portunus trituberculatus]|uniref:Elongation factor Ts, mitochondrial n=1 Tax=Portunus trituberculatus TaxID=210409 RepID=A0A5B7D5P0_PORTR|nr:Elongation factor Ts, mitochondrial [Portunus trituberculatus]
MVHLDPVTHLTLHYSLQRAQILHTIRLGAPHLGRRVIRASHQQRGVFGESHAVDAVCVCLYRIQGHSFRPALADPTPHGALEAADPPVKCPKAVKGTPTLGRPEVRHGAALHTGCTLWKADKSLLAKLRRKTGFSISNCKKALELHDNDADKAESWLRAQAQAQGWEKATKLSGRSTTQGLVGIHIDGQSGVLVEVNCETDFVARNEKFAALVSQVTRDFFQQAATATPPAQGVVKESFSEEQVRAVATEDGKTLGDKLALAIGTIGENMSLPRATRVTVDQDTQLVGYCHPSTMDQDMPRGRYGSILALRTHRPLTEVAKQLCAHVIDCSPSNLNVLVGAKDVYPGVGQNNASPCGILNGEARLASLARHPPDGSR